MASLLHSVEAVRTLDAFLISDRGQEQLQSMGGEFDSPAQSLVRLTKRLRKSSALVGS